jgi:hypothetical protein
MGKMYGNVWIAANSRISLPIIKGADMGILTEGYCPRLCESCAGSGVIDVGDCENGVWDECPSCEGSGEEME